MESLRQDVRLAVRLLRKQPGFSLLAIATLAIGIGLSTALFSVLDAAFIRPLPYYSPENLVDVHIGISRGGDRMSYQSPSLDDIRDWQAHGGTFTHVALSRYAFTDPLILDGEQPLRLLAQRVSRAFFPMYGVTPFLGRTFSDAEYETVDPSVVLLGHDFWKTRFGGDRNVVGTTVKLNEEPVSVIGVLPSWFYAETEIWRPFDLRRDATRRGSGAGIDARLRPGLSLEAAQAELNALMTRASQARGGPAATVRLTSMYQAATRSNVKTARVIAYGVGLVLLLACVNVAGLLLARGAARRPELAVRASIGARRGRLVRQLLTENLVLAGTGAALGVLLAWLSLDLLVANVPMSLPDNAPVDINVKVLAFAVAMALVTTALFGLFPAWRMSRVTAGDVLARAGRGQGSALTHRTGKLLIACEIALALVLLAGAGLMIRSFTKVMEVNLGFDPHGVIAMEVSPATPGRAAHAAYYPELIEYLRARPGVAAVGAVDYAPLVSGSRFTSAVVPGKEPAGVGVRQYMGDFFAALGVTLTDGRFPTDADRARAVPLVVLNESARKEFFGGERAVGQQIRIGRGPAVYEIAGVIEDLRHSGPLSTPEPELWYPFDPNEERGAELVVVVKPSAAGGISPADVRQAAFATGRRVIVDEVARGTTWLTEDVRTPRRRTVLFGLLGAFGFLLALVGVFGMTAYAVARRTREIGVRMAFGATPGNVVRAEVRASVWPVVLGVAAGLIGSWWATQVIQTFLFETEPRDLTTFAIVAALLSVAAIVAAWIPARRAARVDPIVALRAE